MPRGKPRAAAMALLGVLLCLVPVTRTTGEPASPRMVTADEAPQWRAIGKLNVAGNRSCTAVLVTDQLVITAAHCMFNFRTGHLAHTNDVKFVAGQWRDSYAALRGIGAISVSPDFRPSLGIWATPQDSDVALLRLDQPIPPDVARPIPIGDRHADTGLAVVGYGRDRAYIPSVRSDCSVTSNKGAVFTLDCLVVPGLSGAPVIAMLPDGPKVVGVVSMAVGKPADPASPALAVEVAPRFDALKAALPLP
jgi:protease YdgD